VRYDQSTKMTTSTADVDRLLESLKNAVLIKEHEVKTLCDKAREILIEESNLVRVKSPVSVSTTRSSRIISSRKLANNKSLI